MRRRLRKALRMLNPIHQAQLTRVLIVPWLLSFWNQRHYELLSEAKLRSTRKSNTVFVFGSGYSINEISRKEWAYFEQHDTLSFNWFFYQRFVRIDYHLIREVYVNIIDRAIWGPKFEEYSKQLRANPYYANTIFLVHAGIRAAMGNRFIGEKKLPPGRPIYRFHDYASRDQKPSPSLSKGLYHQGTLTDCVNLANLLGWKEIVLVGVDLYDQRYFWLDYDENREGVTHRGLTFEDRHYMADPTIALMGLWRKLYAEAGVDLCVYNPNSLLAQVMPVYQPNSPKGSQRVTLDLVA